MNFKESIYAVKSNSCSLKTLMERCQKLDRAHRTNEINILLSNIGVFEEQDLENIFPIVTYDDWVVCRNEENKQVFVVCAEGVFFTEVCKAEKSEDVGVHDGAHGQFADFDFCGESDDMTMYFWFNRGGKYEKI